MDDIFPREDWVESERHLFITFSFLFLMHHLFGYVLRNTTLPKYKLKSGQFFFYKFVTQPTSETHMTVTLPLLIVYFKRIKENACRIASFEGVTQQLFSVKRPYCGEEFKTQAIFIATRSLFLATRSPFLELGARII